MRLTNINPFTLASVALENKKQLPEKSGVYFVLDDAKNIYYIGKASNLQAAWKNHHRYSQLKDKKGVKIAFLERTLTPSLSETVDSLIVQFRPKLNFTAKPQKSKKEVKEKSETYNLTIKLTPDDRQKLIEISSEYDLSLSDTVAKLINTRYAYINKKCN